MNELEVKTGTPEPSAKTKLSRIKDYSLKGDYDVTLQMVPKDNGGTPACTHRLCGGGKHDLCALLTVGGIVAGGAALALVLVHGACSMMCKK